MILSSRPEGFFFSPVEHARKILKESNNNFNLYITIVRIL